MMLVMTGDNNYDAEKMDFDANPFAETENSVDEDDRRNCVAAGALISVAGVDLRSTVKSFGNIRGHSSAEDIEPVSQMESGAQKEFPQAQHSSPQLPHSRLPRSNQGVKAMAFLFGQSRCSTRNEGYWSQKK